MSETFSHNPVLLSACLDGLALRANGCYLDGTFGRGGHSRALLAQLGPEGRLWVSDKDPEALAVARALADEDGRVQVVAGSFLGLLDAVREAGLVGKVDGILLDLGVSSPQLDDAARGFSFRLDGPLDMRMDPTRGQSAADWLAHAEAGEIARVLKEYGEERFAKRIANAIVAQRKGKGAVRTTAELAAVVSAANPKWERDKHPATRSFQAIRIHINGELDELDDFLAQAIGVLAPAGRLAIISFHSLEDRRVKQFLRDQAKGDDYPPDMPIPAHALHPKVRLVGKAIRADADELALNPRARSAVLRVAERLVEGGA